MYMVILCRGVRNGDSPRDGTVWARIAIQPSCETSKACGPDGTSHKHSNPGQLPRCDVPKSRNLTTSEVVERAINFQSLQQQENSGKCKTVFHNIRHSVTSSRTGPVNEQASSDFQAVNNANWCEFQDMSGQHSPPLWVSGNPVRRLAAVEILPMMGGPQHQYGHDVVQGILGIYTRAPKTCKWMRVRWAYSTKKNSGI